MQLKNELASFMQHRHASKLQLQSLVGKLNWAAAVVYGRRVFLRRIINSFSPLTHKAHKTVITPALRADIEWWHTSDALMHVWRGVQDPGCRTGSIAIG